MYMNKEAVEMLQKILKKDLSLLTSVDKAFLKARRGYLSDEQIEKFAEILSDYPIVERIATPEAPQVPQTPEAPVVPTVKFADLLAKGQRMGLKVKIGMKKEIVEAMIAEAEAKGLSDKPAQSPEE